ncbi:hypothetical protein [Phenylobacterium kunshanense]|uniref:Uncharacterized protein n=1 Tax=Phenylobacterium kunshanense TaxID=1445034 RepID=A0A328BV11_9CAUL|nr:hypothetical protein [Phenylobacterium kunshanense]RAK68888.1 hypothetical protein DJ019_02415 [Phenylobacterium kunshanense]
MRETALEFRRRAAWLADMASPRAGWADRGVMDAAYALEALGVPPDGFSRVLSLIEEMRGGYIPAGLTNIAKGYRIGVTDDLGRCSGEPLGTYRGAVILAWAIDFGR